MIFAFLQNIGPWQLVICIVVAFVLFGGAKKIPDLARSLGKAKSEFKKGIAEGEKEEEEQKESAKEPQKELA
ncbi:MAG: twin-arginine translocase TatA/TatE family subunit [Kiritimatiellae bacterium]|nr:twin-arginine translocase TatA/TatE family subunit [Kiritimatiellia bacterium]MBR2941267.1 twin-arginine translocase TatA/TatE family subunit [Kiritimatiellia bacterium]